MLEPIVNPAVKNSSSKVNDGMLAGAIVTMCWWALEEFAGLASPDAAIVAASVVIATYLVSTYMPERRTK